MTASIRNSTDTPTMRLARTNSMLWPALATTAATMAAAPLAADPKIWSIAVSAAAPAGSAAVPAGSGGAVPDRPLHGAAAEPISSTADTENLH